MPFHEVLLWPGWVTDAYWTYFLKEPHPLVRIERTLARVGARYMNATGAKGDTTQPADFLVPHDAWDEPPPPDPDAPIVSMFSR